MPDRTARVVRSHPCKPAYEWYRRPEVSMRHCVTLLHTLVLQLYLWPTADITGQLLSTATTKLFLTTALLLIGRFARGIRLRALGPAKPEHLVPSFSIKRATQMQAPPHYRQQQILTKHRRTRHDSLALFHRINERGR